MPILSSFGALTTRYVPMGSTGYYFLGWVDSNSFSNSVMTDSSGNIYLGGGLLSSGGTVPTSFLLKYNNDGVLIWQKSVTISATNTYINQVAVDPSQNVHFIGYEGLYKSIAAKFNSSGTIQFDNYVARTTANKTITGNGNICDSLGNIYITGNVVTNETSGAIDGLYVAKLSSSGSMLWYRIVNTVNIADAGNNVSRDSSNNVYAVGFNGSNLYLGAFNSSGTSIYQSGWIYTNGSYIRGHGIASSSDGISYIAGSTNNNGGAGIVMKVDAAGSLVWIKELSGTGLNLYDIVIDSAQNSYAVGYSTSVGSSGTYIVSHDSSGNLRWQRRLYIDSSNCINVGIDLDIFGNFIVTGRDSPTIDSNSNIIFAKLPTSGMIPGTGVYSSSIGTIHYEASSLTSIDPSLTTSTPPTPDTAFVIASTSQTGTVGTPTSSATITQLT